MDPQRILLDIWSWLPAFRAVAETQHLPTASKRLHVSVSALSRTIRLVEERVGQELFNRSGRTLVLNTAGAEVLAAVREAMASVDRALGAIRSDPYSGPVRISTLGVLTNYYVLPAILELKARHPALVPCLANHRTREANDLLLRGSLDVAFYYEAVEAEGLEVAQLGTMTASVYCGRGHPLFDRRSLRLAEVLEHPFSVPDTGDTGVPMDSWPVDRPRRIGMRITLLATNLEVCLSGRLLTVLPDVVAHPHRAAGALRRLPFDLLPATPLFAAWRRSESAKGRVSAIVGAVQEEVRRVDQRLARVEKSRRRRS